MQSACKAIARSRPPAGKPHIDAILRAGKAEWGGVKWVEFGANGELKTPWGAGTWADALPSAIVKPNTIVATFIGQDHLLTFDGDAFTSKRCSDGEAVSGKLASVPWTAE